MLHLLGAVRARQYEAIGLKYFRRVPPQGSSTEGESGPKIRPKGVVDGQHVNIPVLPSPEGRRRLGRTGQGTVSGRQFLWIVGLLKRKGGVQRFPRAGWRLALSAKVEWSLTARPTCRAGTKVGLSDSTVPSGRAVAQRIKVTLGITG
ncbi:hypothetical protein E3N88_28774 [Mikania micrantha]|uniref:Uncharacterized protein n=1 Tax=Mikania micrantha TaxID=192012 RepID=A0A5N6N0F0_9ASTR|nr:hypothetical protein E3N88_28774 [Mikania micrantha]